MGRRKHQKFIIEFKFSVAVGDELLNTFQLHEVAQVPGTRELKIATVSASDPGNEGRLL